MQLREKFAPDDESGCLYDQAVGPQPFTRFYVAGEWDSEPFVVADQLVSA